MKHSWWQESVVYQVYPRSFQDTNNDGIGDLQGIIQHLDYIKELGANVIWLNPIYESPNDDNGYDISDYQKIMNDFGTMSDFEQLLSECHSRGLKLMMDLVVNHTSDEHPWFIESQKSRSNPYSDYYIWRDATDANLPNNWRSEFNGPAWKYVPERDQYYLHIFSKKQPDLNWSNKKVRQEIFSMMQWWCDKGIDGFRMDVINLISKIDSLPNDQTIVKNPNGSSMLAAANGPDVHNYLKEMNKEVLSHFDLITVGETPGVSTNDAKKYAGFNTQELNMIFQFEHTSLSDDYKTGKWNNHPVKLSELKKTLSRWQTELNGKAWNSLYWSNHDQPRAVSRFGNDNPEYRELSAKMLANCLHMMQGTPYIYQGEELGMTNNSFTELSDYRDLATLNAYHELVEESKEILPADMMNYIRFKSRDNARTPMQWNGYVNAGFSTHTPWIKVNPNFKDINAQAAMKEPNSIFYFYQKLIKLRKQYPIIVYGDYELLDPKDEEVFSYRRSLDNDTLLVVCNFTSKKLMRSLCYSDMENGKELIIANYINDTGDVLRPYETRTYLYKNNS